MRNDLDAGEILLGFPQDGRVVADFQKSSVGDDASRAVGVAALAGDRHDRRELSALSAFEAFEPSGRHAAGAVDLDGDPQIAGCPLAARSTVGLLGEQVLVELERDATRALGRRALDSGVQDFVIQPVDRLERITVLENRRARARPERFPRVEKVGRAIGARLTGLVERVHPRARRMDLEQPADRRLNGANARAHAGRAVCATRTRAARRLRARNAGEQREDRDENHQRNRNTSLRDRVPGHFRSPSLSKLLKSDFVRVHILECPYLRINWTEVEKTKVDSRE